MTCLPSFVPQITATLGTTEDPTVVDMTMATPTFISIKVPTCVGQNSGQIVEALLIVVDSCGNEIVFSSAVCFFMLDSTLKADLAVFES